MKQVASVFSLILLLLHPSATEAAPPDELLKYYERSKDIDSSKHGIVIGDYPVDLIFTVKTNGKVFGTRRWQNKTNTNQCVKFGGLLEYSAGRAFEIFNENGQRVLVTGPHETNLGRPNQKAFYTVLPGGWLERTHELSDQYYAFESGKHTYRTFVTVRTYDCENLEEIVSGRDTSRTSFQSDYIYYSQITEFELDYQGKNSAEKYRRLKKCYQKATDKYGEYTDEAEKAYDKCYDKVFEK